MTGQQPKLEVIRHRIPDGRVLLVEVVYGRHGKGKKQSRVATRASVEGEKDPLTTEELQRLLSEYPLPES